MTEASRTISLADSTLEAFAKRAGLPCKTGAVIVTENCFIVATPDNNKYIARFRRNGAAVEHFESPNLGRTLTREEARDVLYIILSCAARSDLRNYADALARLEKNLPSFGFGTPTPLMAERAQPAPRPTQNAKLWTWSLVNE
jgi:hypothetical protein